MYISALTLATTAEPAQPRPKYAHEYEPYSRVSVLRLALEPRVRPAPSCGEGAQLWHTAELLAPRVEEKVPAEHAEVHVAEVRPGVDPYVPMGHSVHAGDEALPTEYEPGAHKPVHVELVRPGVDP